jgi:transposase
VQALYSIRSERLLMERLEYDLLFRWFAGIGADDAVWDHSVFSKNRDRVERASSFIVTLLIGLPIQGYRRNKLRRSCQNRTA